MRTPILSVIVCSIFVALAGCQTTNVEGHDVDDPDGGDTDTDTDTDTDADTDTETETDTGTEVWTPPENSLVYANTQDNLYVIDPAEGGDLVLVGALSAPCIPSGDTNSGLYDIAVSADGVMVGIAAEALYTVDTETAACTLLKEFPVGAPHFFSLSWVVGVDPAEPEVEKLVAASVEEGEWVEVNPEGTTLDEIFVHLGYHDPPDYELVSSGDIVSVQVGPTEWVTYVTLKCADGYTATGCESDFLAVVNPETGLADVIGTTGFTRIFGLGFWGDEVYGFTNQAKYLTIDVTTGLATEKLTHDAGFWGAGTTTKPYVVIE
jgi:hypothetical protein